MAAAAAADMEVVATEAVEAVDTEVVTEVVDTEVIIMIFVYKKYVTRKICFTWFKTLSSSDNL